jgi:hypothetical protein
MRRDLTAICSATNTCWGLRRAGASRSITVLLLSTRAGSRSNYGPTGAQSDGLFHVEQERFCGKITIPAPAVIQLHQIPQTPVCQQMPFVRYRVEVCATCLRHEEARVTARTDPRVDHAASRTQRHYEAKHIPNRKTLNLKLATRNDGRAALAKS